MHSYIQYLVEYTAGCLVQDLGLHSARPKSVFSDEVKTDMKAVTR